MSPRQTALVIAAKSAQAALRTAAPSDWAERFVLLKMWFFKACANGNVCSISHGTEYFDNIVAACEGRLEWKEKGEYGENFRRMTS